MLLGVGVDVLHVPRLRALLLRRSPEQFARRILCNVEQEQYQAIGASRRVRFLAVRHVPAWALKEAAYKAFYPAMKLTWKDVAIQRHGPKPSLVLCSSLSKNLTGPVHCSVSHDGDYVFATVIAERARPQAE
ncbi:4'-phosphopantetheinyl transferase [Auricularia subglabra TFB-10046 SS5]|nr:4'-phosphopantetheinyl transferase [Auricularia subglabra TFB-10046 SS5]